MAAIVQWLERLIVVQDVEGSNPSSRPISFRFNSKKICKFLALFQRKPNYARLTLRISKAFAG